MGDQCKKISSINATSVAPTTWRGKMTGAGGGQSTLTNKEKGAEGRHRDPLKENIGEKAHNVARNTGEGRSRRKGAITSKRKY